MGEEKSSAWQTIVSGNGTRPLGIFPSGTIELVLCILIREIVKVGRLQWIDWFLSIALKVPARACMLLCSNLLLLPSYENRIKGVTSKIHILRDFAVWRLEVFCKNDSMVCICSLLQWEPRGEYLLGCALQEMGKQQDAPSLQGTQSLLRCERLHWTQFLEILRDLPLKKPCLAAQISCILWLQQCGESVGQQSQAAEFPGFVIFLPLRQELLLKRINWIMSGWFSCAEQLELWRWFTFLLIVSTCRF